jgi:hypothetical protein
MKKKILIRFKYLLSSPHRFCLKKVFYFFSNHRTMWFLLFFLSISPSLVAASVADCGQVKVRRSVALMVGNGTSYSSPGQWPWLAPLFYDLQFVCESSLITKWHLLTGEGH